MALDSSSTLKAIEDDSLGLLIQSSLAEQENRDNLKKAKETAESLATLEATSGIDRAIIASTAAGAELSSQRNKLKAANAAGVNPSSAMDSLLDTISQLQTTQQKTRERLNTYNSLSDRGIFNGGPVNWIKNAVNLEEASQAVERGVKTADVLTKQVDQINNVVQQSAVTHNAIKQSLTEAAVDANNRLILTEAEIKSRQASLEALKYNSTLINNAKDASKERLAALYNLQQARNSEIQLNRSLAALKLSEEKFSWEKEEKKILDQARAEGKDGDSYIVDLISTGRAARGASALDSRGIKTMLQIFKSGGAASKELYIDYQNGERSKVAGTPMLGATPAESLDTLQLLGTTVASVREETIQLFKDAREATAQNKLIDPKNKEAMNGDFNKNVRTLVRDQFSLIKPGSGNIFDVGDLRSYLGNSTDDKMGVSSMKNLGISQKLLLPAIEANQPMNDPKIVVQLAIAAVKKGTISSSEYLELSDVYRRANELNQASLNLPGLGIIPPNNGKNYFISIGSLGDRQTLDLTDPVSMSRYLSQELASVFSPSGAIRRNPFGVMN